MGGGLDLFQGEDAKYQQCAVDALVPRRRAPAWEILKRGSHIDSLDTATGFIRNMLERKYGHSLPLAPLATNTPLVRPRRVRALLHLQRQVNQLAADRLAAVMAHRIQARASRHGLDSTVFL